MTDIWLEWGCDLSVGANGDLLLSEGTNRVNQRLVRRLLTNPGDYIWNLSYGAGLALSVGEPAEVSKIEAIIRRQIELEPAIPTSPAPTITVKSIDPAIGSFMADVIYGGGGPAGSRKVSISQR